MNVATQSKPSEKLRPPKEQGNVGARSVCSLMHPELQTLFSPSAHTAAQPTDNQPLPHRATTVRSHNLDSEADLTYQQTGPRISLPSPSAFNNSRKYLTPSLPLSNRKLCRPTGDVENSLEINILSEAEVPHIFPTPTLDHVYSKTLDRHQPPSQFLSLTHALAHKSNKAHTRTRILAQIAAQRQVRPHDSTETVSEIRMKPRTRPRVETPQATQPGKDSEALSESECEEVHVAERVVLHSAAITPSLRNKDNHKTWVGRSSANAGHNTVEVQLSIHVCVESKQRQLSHHHTAPTRKPQTLPGQSRAETTSCSRQCPE
jgi:hypothetical protein